jgi:hypothetical protein
LEGPPDLDDRLGLAQRPAAGVLEAAQPVADRVHVHAELPRGRLGGAVVVEVTKTAKLGAGSLALTSGTLQKKKLAAGSYRATITATVAGAARPSAAKTAGFKISRP